MSYTARHDQLTGKFLGVTRQSDGAQIPPEPSNRAWRRFVAWNDNQPLSKRITTADLPAPVQRRLRGAAALLADYDALPAANLRPDFRLPRRRLLVAAVQANPSLFDDLPGHE